MSLYSKLKIQIIITNILRRYFKACSSLCDYDYTKFTIYIIFIVQINTNNYT